MRRAVAEEVRGYLSMIRLVHFVVGQRPGCFDHSRGSLFTKFSRFSHLCMLCLEGQKSIHVFPDLIQLHLTHLPLLMHE